MSELKVLHFPSQKTQLRSIRGKKFMIPDCREWNEQHKTWVDGPCKRPGVTVLDWTRCTHGAPTREELALAGWVPDSTVPTYATPCYFERDYREKTRDEVKEVAPGELEVTKTIVSRTLFIQPRIRDVSASIRNASGAGPAIAEMSGGMEVMKFGIAPFCEYWGCFEQNPKEYKNGMFCTELEAKLVWADENGEVLALGYGASNSKSRQVRAAQLAAIAV